MNIRGLLSKKGIPWFLGVVVLILLGIMSIPVAFASKESGVIAFTVPVVVLLVFSMAMKVFVMKTFNGKIAWYVLDGALLLLLTLVSNWQNESGNLISYNYIMCALVLSEFYLSSPSLRDNVIMFCVIAGAYTVAYIIIAIRNNFINSAFRTAAQYFTDLIILLLHFVMFNFAMTVYRKNKIIEEKVRELEDSRNELLRAHDKLEEATLIEERNRIAKEIHDTAGHSLTTVIMQTEAAKLSIDKDPETAKRCVTAANIQAKNCLDELRLSVHLLSGRRENVTFKEYLEGILGETGDGTNITVRSKIDDISMKEEAERFIANTLREGISNGVRHGKSTAFFFELKDMGNFVEFLLSDNGTGIDMKNFKEGFGLSGMRAKAEQLGGMIRFSSEEGEGFEISMSLPGSMKEEKHEN
ncbi:MAG TPA: sensor histidine kinase [Candidatus Borkfalkia excrementavium]|uniref:Oxygen sensor histidine kinase NreB n=1 Tax=Candidatus Borkfalkia excrementavium TaxID=2838505 RepID=A0A9D1Z9Z0_9FIRM|nr:sensor histidine kinase [Candidatus Borkfalkia excrementavium]